MDSTRLAQIRKNFYLSTRARVESIIGRETSQLGHYRKKYEAEMRRMPYSSVRKRQFIHRMKKARLILVGDFHALKQSSRGLLRILRKMDSPVILCLECIYSEDQRYLDQFLAGVLNEKDFLSRIQWKKKWSFPWENYRPLFKWAQSTNAKVFGINISTKAKTLKERDEASAELIQKIRLANQQEQIFIQFK